jgi:hypothetical protein
MTILLAVRVSDPDPLFLCPVDSVEGSSVPDSVFVCPVDPVVGLSKLTGFKVRSRLRVGVRIKAS